MRNKIFTKIIITTLLCAFLTFSVGKVTRVSAVGTTVVASAAAALCAVGIVYCSYMALTGASVHVPDSSYLEEWLTDIGTKVVQYPSGKAAYQELYPDMLTLGPGTLIHDFLDSEVWTWTADKLKAWANDFSSTEIISNIAEFTQAIEGSDPTTNFDYPYDFQVPQKVSNYYNQITTLDALAAEYNFIYPTGARACRRIAINNELYLFPFTTTITSPVRNLLNTSGYYVPQIYNGNAWETIYNFPTSVGLESLINGTFGGTITPRPQSNDWNYGNTYGNTYISEQTYPVWMDADIYVEATGEVIEKIASEDVEVLRPQWPDLPPEDDNKPVIPYVKLPYDPNWINPVTNVPGGGNWGFDLGRLLDTLEDLARELIDIGSIGALINEFRDLITGETYYIYYDDSTHNYYEFYTITNYGDTIYNYDIDVSEADEHLPVDLNTIQTYSSNRYLEQIKQSAINGSSIIRDFAVFWYDVDPEVTYIALGICILVLIGAFTGKLGHS